MVRTTLAAYLLFAVPHLLFHVTHHQHYTTTQAAAETTGLSIATLLPLMLLTLTWRSRDDELRGVSRGHPQESPPVTG